MRRGCCVLSPSPLLSSLWRLLAPPSRPSSASRLLLHKGRTASELSPGGVNTWRPVLILTTRLRDKARLKSNYGNIYLFIYLYSCTDQTVLRSFREPSSSSSSSSSSSVMKMNERSESPVYFDPRCFTWPPPSEPDHHTTLALSQHTASVCGSGDAKNRRSERAEQTSRRSFIF